MNQSEVIIPDGASCTNCLICKDKFSTSKQLDVHIKTFHLRMYTCNECPNFSTMIKMRMVQHNRKLHSYSNDRNRPNQEITTKKRSAEDHDQSNPAKQSKTNDESPEQARFECDQCWFTSETKNELDDHVKDKHGAQGKDRILDIDGNDDLQVIISDVQSIAPADASTLIVDHSEAKNDINSAVPQGLKDSPDVAKNAPVDVSAKEVAANDNSEDEAQINEATSKADQIQSDVVENLDDDCRQSSAASSDSSEKLKDKEDLVEHEQQPSTEDTSDDKSESDGRENSSESLKRPEEKKLKLFEDLNKTIENISNQIKFAVSPSANMDKLRVEQFGGGGNPELVQCKNASNEPEIEANSDSRSL